MADNETFVRDLSRAGNDRDYDSIAGSVAPDCILVEEGSGRTLRGPEGFTQLAKAM
ncbi:hypothetical protein ACF09G_05060 [Streptomyces albogriseolus]|uniref:hypothetical protein n=1 Tax=Streptomyces albogriseolus TaxID=1887 RepID=UPI0036FC401A